MRAALLASIACSIVLMSCASLRIADDLPEGSPRGYVSFYTAGLDPAPNLMIARVVDGRELPAMRNGDALSGWGDFRVACPAGPQDFVVRHGNYQEAFKVDVAPGSVTFLSFYEQLLARNTSSDTYNTTTTTTYYVRGSRGSHALPADPKAADPAPYLAALEDGDWGTRREALLGLRRLKASLDPAAQALASRIAREDASAAVRREALALLRSLGLPAPREALFLESFQDNSRNRWYTSRAGDEGPSFALDPAGYALGSKDGNSHWASISLPGKIAALEDYDVAVDCEWRGGEEDRAYGFTLGPDADAFHAFCVSKNGGAMAYRFAGSKAEAFDLPWSQAAASAMAASPVVRIEVAKRGASYSVKAAGQSVGSFTEPSAMPVRRIGVFVWGAAEVVFRELLVLP